MKTLILQRKRLAGFSLVELAIVLLITTIILSAGLGLLSLKREASQREATQKKQETIKQALINYLGQNKRLPCPAIVSPAATPPYTGAEDRSGSTPAPCKQYSGIVPYQELGLDRAAALDGWDNFITYVVSPPKVLIPPAQPAGPAPLLSTAWLYTYNNITLSNVSPFTKTTTPNPVNTNPITAVSITATDPAFWPSTSTGGIIVTDGTNTIADPFKATGAVVVLISYGKNGYGAFNVKGAQNNFTPAGTDQKQNADSTMLVIGNPPAIKVVKRDSTDLTTGGGAFDDIVMMLSANDLTGPLIGSGTLQSSAEAALSQANDAVIGKIIASRSNPCPLTSTTQNSAAPVCTTLVCTTYDTATPPNCISSVCTAYSTYNTSSTSSTNVCYYDIPVPASIIFTAPPNVAAWGVVYSQVATRIYATTYLPITATNAYTLTAGDGSTKTVSIQELQGILARAAGFN